MNVYMIWEQTVLYLHSYMILYDVQIHVTYSHVCTYIYINIQTYIYTSVNIYIYKSIYVNIHIHIYIDRYIDIDRCGCVALLFKWIQLFQLCPAAGTFEMAAKPFGTSANFKPADGDKQPGNLPVISWGLISMVHSPKVDWHKSKQNVYFTDLY